MGRWSSVNVGSDFPRISLNFQLWISRRSIGVKSYGTNLGLYVFTSKSNNPSSSDEKDLSVSVLTKHMITNHQRKSTNFNTEDFAPIYNVNK
jgi:hypothetical protein